MRIVGKKLRQFGEMLIGKIVPVYETDYDLCPMRTKSAWIGTGEIVNLTVPKELAMNIRDEGNIKTAHGIFCLVRFTSAAPLHQSKVGQEYIFNVADEDWKKLIDLDSLKL